MTVPIKISHRLVEEKPYLVWNAFVDLISRSGYTRLSRMQRPAHLVFWYYTEVENGGHMQFFENRGTRRVKDTVAALNLLGAHCHAGVLARAVGQFSSKPRSRIRSVEEYVETALEGEFDQFDSSYARCQPELQKALESFLSANQAEFVVVGQESDRGFIEREAAMEKIGRSILKRMKERRA